MEHTVFNDIVAGKIPCHKVYEDEKYLAFLDIFPRTQGHTLLIPKTHYRWSYEVADFSEYWQTALKVTHILQQALMPKWVNYFTHGLIPYAHIHILPRYDEMTENTPPVPTVIKYTKDEMRELSEKIQAVARAIEQ